MLILAKSGHFGLYARRKKVPHPLLIYRLEIGSKTKPKTAAAKYGIQHTGLKWSCCFVVCCYLQPHKNPNHTRDITHKTKTQK